ncbi:MAG: TonB-dependent receptor [Flavobacteriaceae bacterium]|nr:TonB-dependent receptor [Flavobacteriaceae bacterium]
MNYFSLLFFILLSSVTFAQEEYTLRGTISDLANGESVFGTTVYLKGTTIGTTTNEYGFYSITAPKGEYTLVISYLGYKEIQKQISLTQDIKLNIEVEEDLNTLDEVVITATDDSKKINIRKPQMGVTTLKASTIKLTPAVLGEVDLIKTIQLLPGVSNNGEGSAGFNVRGGAVDQNLVLLDEAIIYNTSHFFGLFSVFNNDAIKSVKLYKGDIPAKFGGRTASVLDVRQKDGNNKNLEINGGIGLISSRLSVEAPLLKKKGSFLLAGRTTYAQYFMSFTDELQNDKISFYDLNLKTNYEINENNKIYLSSYFGRDVFNISNLFNSNYGNISANLRWNHIFNDKLFSNLSLIYSKYDYQIVLDFVELDWISDITNYNIKYDFGYYASDKIKIDFGVSGISYSLNPGEITPNSETSPINPLILDKKRAFEGGAYIDAEHKITDKLTARYGLRYSAFSRLGGQAITNYANNQPVVYNQYLGIYQEGEAIGETVYSKSETIKQFGNFEPRFGLSYLLTDDSSVKGSYTRTAQYLHLLSNTASVSPLDVWTTSGTYIKPQLSNQYALGFYKKFNNNAYSFEAETYYKTTENRIDYIDGADLIGNNYIETQILNGEARAYGLELMFRKNKGRLTGWVSYTLAKSEQRSFGGNAGGPGINNGNWYNTPYDRTHDISVTGIYKFTDKWTFSANAIYQTGRPVTYPTGQFEYEGISVIIYDDRNANRLPAYHRIDVSATYKPNRKPNNRLKGEWVFSVYNLYNRRNAASITFNQNYNTGANEALRTSIFGIIPSVTYNFKF